MTRFAADFPHQGRIENPTIDDYRMELSLMRMKPSQGGDCRRWEGVIRRLQFAAEARTSAANRYADDLASHTTGTVN